MFCLQKLSHNGVSVHFETDFQVDNESLCAVSETECYRIVIEHDGPVRVKIGDLEMLGHHFDYAGRNFYIFSGDLKAAELKQEKEKQLSKRFFQPLFLNSVGNSIIKVITSDEIFEIKVEISSPKVPVEEVYRWVQEINKIFPLFNSGVFISPIIFGNARAGGTSSVRSLSSEIQRIKFLLSEIKLHLKRPGYLASKKIRAAGDYRVANGLQAYEKPDWLDVTQDWRKAPSHSRSIVRKGPICFEPNKFPFPKMSSSFDHPLNRVLMGLVNDLAVFAKSLIRSLGSPKDMAANVREVQIKTKEGAAELYSHYLEGLKDIEKATLALSLQLESVGISEGWSGLGRPDPRFELLNSHILQLRDVTNNFRSIDISGSLEAGLLSTDKIFEFFCYSAIVDCLQEKLDFKLIDCGVSFPVNYFAHFLNEKTGLEIRLFFDYPVPKASEQSDSIPLVDALKYGANKRPDFILHIESKDFESIAILDAKYMGRKNALEKFKTFNGENLLVKYGTKFFQTSGIGAPPIFIGAIHLGEDHLVDTTRFDSVLQEQHSSGFTANAFQQAGISDLTCLGRNGITEMMQHILEHFMLLKSNSLEIEKPKYSKPKRILQTQSFFESRNTKSGGNQSSGSGVRKQDWREAAPTLNEEDGSLIKGMLERGDKQQDIAMFFGVNSGRIAEVKEGIRFADVKPTPFDSLPPMGPYPPIRDFLGFSKK